MSWNDYSEEDTSIDTKSLSDGEVLLWVESALPSNKDTIQPQPLISSIVSDVKEDVDVSMIDTELANYKSTRAWVKNRLNRNWTMSSHQTAKQNNQRNKQRKKRL